jgi:SAM-dependent methyltransferase
MGTATTMGDLWGAKAADWAELGEPASDPAFRAVFAGAGVGPGTRVLDVGCGAGTALALARSMGAEVAGLDASEALIAIARTRLPGARLEVGDMEALPFADASFDVVTGFNSFQFAGDIPRALAEAARVCRPGGSVTMCVWGSPEECESFSRTIVAMMALAPAPPAKPSNPSRPPLFTPGVLEGLMREAGLEPATRDAVDVPFEFPDAATAWRCYASAGNGVGLVRRVGEAPVREAVLASLVPFTGADGSVRQRNRFHWLMAKKPS